MKLKFNNYGWIVIHYAACDSIYGMTTGRNFFDTKKAALDFYRKNKDQCWIDPANIERV